MQLFARAAGVSRILLCATFALPVAAFAQTGRPIEVQVRVADINSAPIAAADVRLTRRGRDETIGGQPTDANGSALLRGNSPDDTLEIEIRHVGFIATRRLVILDSARSAVVAIRLAPLEVRLDTVRTIERPLPLDERPVVDSLEIASSKRPIIDLDDLLRKLRPSMFYQLRRCPRGSLASPSLRAYVNDTYVSPGDFVFLRTRIYGEQIAEVRYVNCFDKALKEDDHPQAGHLYVTLKRGFAYDVKRGSYPIDSAHAPKLAKAQPNGAIGRLVGVFDEVTGLPIEGASITDILSRQYALTSRLGELALYFVAPNGLIRIDKVGYKPQVMTVDNSPGAPDLTVLLSPRSSAPMTAGTVTKSATDTSTKLEVVGFHARRDGWPVTESAFYLAGDIATMGRVSTLLVLTQRPSCIRDVRVDGAPIPVDSTQAHRWIDAALKPDMIAGVEVYVGDLPPEFAALGDTARSKHRCLTLIWTR